MTRIYAIGDIHGRLDLLEQIYVRISAHAASAASGRRVIVHLGDYVDRGFDSKGVLSRVRAGIAGFENVALKGNHEQLMLDFLESGAGDRFDHWMRMGGDEVLRSYGLSADPAPSNLAVQGAIGPDLLRWLHALPTSYREGGLFFAHAGVRPGVPLDRQTDEDLMWIRRPFLTSGDDFGARVVHGHTPAHEPEIEDNRIGIDTGAVWTGRLTAAALDPDDPRAEPGLLFAHGPTLDELEDRRGD